MTHDPRTFARHQQFARSVASYLRARGYVDAKVPTTGGKLSDRLKQSWDEGHIEGLPFAAAVAATQAPRPSDLLSAATSWATESGRDLGVAILARPGKDIESAYAVLTFSDFLSLLGDPKETES